MECSAHIGDTSFLDDNIWNGSKTEYDTRSSEYMCHIECVCVRRSFCQFRYRKRIHSKWLFVNNKTSIFIFFPIQRDGRALQKRVIPNNNKNKRQTSMKRTNEQERMSEKKNRITIKLN